jgi:hypothetical protein
MSSSQPVDIPSKPQTGSDTGGQGDDAPDMTKGVKPWVSPSGGQ